MELTKTPPKRRGRKPSKPPEYPLQAQKMGELLDYLKVTGQVANQADFGRPFKIGAETVSRWQRGQEQITDANKWAIQGRYNLPVYWWDAPRIPIEEVMLAVELDAEMLLDVIDRRIIGLRGYFDRTRDFLLKEGDLEEDLDVLKGIISSLEKATQDLRDLVQDRGGAVTMYEEEGKVR